MPSAYVSDAFGTWHLLGLLTLLLSRFLWALVQDALLTFYMHNVLLCDWCLLDCVIKK